MQRGECAWEVFGKLPKTTGWQPVLPRSSHIIRFSVRIFSPVRGAKSGSSLVAHADSSKANRNRADRGLIFPPQDNAADHLLSQRADKPSWQLSLHPGASLKRY